MVPKLAVDQLRTMIKLIPFGQEGPRHAGKEHLLEMLRKVESEEVEGEKAHRWIGYVQGVLGTMGVSLETLKGINHDANWKFASMLAIQYGGKHYKTLPIQPVEYMHANGLDYNRGAVVKYVTRDKVKNGAGDVKKAIHFCQFILEQDYGVRSSVVEFEETWKDQGRRGRDV